jgi:cytoskeletal protein CcmA (bactofilin family)
MIISGEVTGNMTAETNIEVHASGKVYGNLIAPTVTIHDGAVFQGHCHSGEKRDDTQSRRPRLHTVVKEETPVEQKETDDETIKSA